MVANDMIDINFLPTILLNFACMDPLFPPTALDLLFIYLFRKLSPFFLFPFTYVDGPRSSVMGKIQQIQRLCAIIYFRRMCD